MRADGSACLVGLSSTGTGSPGEGLLGPGKLSPTLAWSPGAVRMAQTQCAAPCDQEGQETPPVSRLQGRGGGAGELP